MDVSTPRTPTLEVRSSDYTRIRDRSMDLTLPRSNWSADFSINGIERLRTRPKIASRDEDERSEEYKNILARTEEYLSTKKRDKSKVKMERDIK
jgi:hypothetical protein